ncbi:MAG: hypothetical protein KatS3mg018_2623 [Fimbriimonadales bacterium]|nr:MAG: hypothetical protein KatS3mg018_2623 [Fimbriimonadales bacterium]
MPVFGPIKRSDLIRYLKQLGFVGPYAGGKHQYMVRGEVKVVLPNPHQGDISRDLLARILRQAGVSREEWEKLLEPQSRAIIQPAFRSASPTKRGARLSAR